MFLFKYEEKTTVGFFLLLIFHNVPQQTNCTKRYISSFNQSLNHHLARKKMVSKSCRFGFTVLLIILVRVVFCQIKRNNPVSRAMWEFFPISQWRFLVFNTDSVDFNWVQNCPRGNVLGRFARNGCLPLAQKLRYASCV